MHVIGPLISGIAGAANGTATIAKRGSSGTAATWYADFDGTTPNATGDAIDLDANGIKEIYVDETVEVTVKSSSGTTIAAWVEMVGDSSIEVKSSSFTGVAYDTGTSAVGNPTTAEAVLNLWKKKNLSTDWKVKVGSTEDTIANFFERVVGMFVNVKAPPYSAQGDDSNDDTTAINDACTAAATNGGIVFFPPGTYRVTSAISAGYKVSLWGCGPNASIIKMNHASNDTLEIYGDASADRYQEIRGLGFEAAQACTGVAIRTQDTFAIISNCKVGDGAFLNAGLLSTNGTPTVGEVIVRDSHFTLNGNATAVRLDEEVYRAVLDNCTVTLSSSQTADVVDIPAIARVKDCYFDSSPASTGTFNFVSATVAGSGDADIQIRGCTFTNGGGATVTAIRTTLGSAGDMTAEFHNKFGTTVTRYSYTDGFYVTCASRELGAEGGAKLQDDSPTVAIDTDFFGTIELEKQSGSTVTINGDANNVPLYARLTVSVWNNGTGGNVTVTWGTGFSVNATMVVPDNTKEVAVFVSLIDSAGTGSEWFQIGTSLDVPE